MKTTATTLPASVIREIADIVREHDRHQGCYFWRPNCHASARRRAEFDRHLAFIVDGRAVDIDQSHSESCRNVYYRLAVTVDGRRSNVSTLRRIIAAAARIAA